jgi:hypothetical protein
MPEPKAAFWELAMPLIAEGKAERGTMMRMECLRVKGEFVAGVAFEGELVVKLDKARVDELVAAGKGKPFAPAGRVFKEWISFPTFDRARWDSMIREACARVVK